MIRRFDAPERAGGLDELLLAQRQHLAAHDPRDVGPVDDRDDHDHHREARLDQAAEAAVGAGACGGEAEAEQQDREGEHHVGEPRQQRVGPAAVEAGDEADGHADDHGEAGGDERDLERDARAVDGAREDVAAEPVDAEGVLGGRAGRRAEDVERLRALDLRAGRADEADDHRREDRRQDQDDDERERGHRDLVASQPAPEQLHRRARGDLGLAGRVLDEDRSARPARARARRDRRCSQARLRAA